MNFSSFLNKAKEEARCPPAENPSTEILSTSKWNSLAYLLKIAREAKPSSIGVNSSNSLTV